jgi:hypothetical protein
VYALVELTGGLTYSLLSPFYTKEATEKGLSVAQTGLVRTIRCFWGGQRPILSFTSKDKLRPLEAKLSLRGPFLTSPLTPKGELVPLE